MIRTRARAVVIVACLGVSSAAGAEDSRDLRAQAGPAAALRLAADNWTSQPQLRTQIPRRDRAPAAEESDARVAQLEQRVAELETQVEQLLSILDVTGENVTIRGRTVRIHGQTSLEIKAPEAKVESQAQLQLKGAPIILNGGGHPVARLGSPVAGGVVSSGAATVLVP